MSEDYRRRCAACGSSDRLRYFEETDSVFKVHHLIAICYECDDGMKCAHAQPRRWRTRLLARIGLRLIETYPRKHIT